MIQKFSSWFVNDIHKKGDGTMIVTKEQIQHELNQLSTKQIVARLVKVRKEEMNKKRVLRFKTLQDQLCDMKRQVKSLNNKLNHRNTKDKDKDNSDDNYSNLMESAGLGTSFVISDTRFAPEVIDDYLFTALNIPVRGVDSFEKKIDTDTRHQIYALMVYCETSYPKLRLSMKSGYSKKDIRSASSDHEALELAMENMMMFVYQHMPSVRDAINQGIKYCIMLL